MTTLHDPPGWLRKSAQATVTAHPRMNLAAPEGTTPRDAAVLMLFGGHQEVDPTARGGLPRDADILLTQRATTMRQHGGQVAFPGGAADPGDDGPVGTALREAREETGLDPAGVLPVALLPRIYVPVSGFEVTPVLAYWRHPSPVRVVDPAEAARVVRVPVRELTDPANRFVIKHRAYGYESPAFTTDGLLIWGFTAGLLAGLLAVSGWEQPWDTGDIRDADTTFAEYDMEVRHR